MVFVAHALFNAWLAYRLNIWYAAFYDQLQSAAALTEVSSGATIDLAERRRAVSQHLVAFAKIVAPAIIVHPVAKWISSLWRFHWRVALVRAYIAHSDPATKCIEGMGQRIHEDTQRFASGLYSCGVTILDSILTLCVFLPVLAVVSAETCVAGCAWDAWLVGVASSAAFGGLGVSVVVSRRLVGLEVQNQVVEADLRTKLVLIEQHQRTQDGTTTAAATTPLARDSSQLDSYYTFPAILKRLHANYSALFRAFAAFNTWISIYDQTLVIVPYALCAPLIFADDPRARITLGTLVKITHAFGKVFGAMAVVTENWAAVNDFRSTLRRLLEFERALYSSVRFNARLLDQDSALSAPIQVEMRVAVE